MDKMARIRNWYVGGFIARGVAQLQLGRLNRAVADLREALPSATK